MRYLGLIALSAYLEEVPKLGNLQILCSWFMKPTHSSQVCNHGCLITRIILKAKLIISRPHIFFLHILPQRKFCSTENVLEK